MLSIPTKHKPWLAFLLLVTAVSSFFVWSPEKQTLSDATLAAPDDILSDVVIREMNKEGRLKSMLHTKQAFHYRRAEPFSELLSPTLWFFSEKTDELNTPWVLQSHHARLFPDQKLVHFWGNVTLTRQNHAVPTRMQTEKLSAHLTEHRAFTDAPVSLVTGAHHIEGTGLEAWLDTHRIQLKSHVRGHHE